MKVVLLSIILGLSFTAGRPALAGAILDQSQTSIDAGLALGDSRVTYAESFTQGSTALLDHIQLYLTNRGGPVTVNLYGGDLPNIATTPLLASATSNNNTFDFSSSGIGLTAGQSYTFDILGGSGSTGAADTNPYAGGRQGFLYSGAGFYPDASKFDVAFQTYDQTAIPEPAPLALLGAGMIGLFCIRLRSARRAA